jgi:hypothetical protein
LTAVEKLQGDSPACYDAQITVRLGQGSSIESLAEYHTGEIMKQCIQWLLDQKTRWAVVYLTLIPLFSVIFWTLPGESFYYSLGKNDPALLVQVASLMESLHDAAAEQSGTNSMPIGSKGLVIDWDKARFHSLNVNSAGEYVLECELDVREVVDLPEESQPLGLGQDDDSFGAGGGGKSSFFGAQNVVFKLDITIDGEQRRAVLEAVPAWPPTPFTIRPEDTIFPSFADNGNSDFAEQQGRIKLLVSEEVASSFKGFRDAVTGQAGRGAEGFLRMLYFSVSAITTTGYGDISPMTDWARALAAVETLLGIVCAGLFIKSISS